MLCKVTRCAGRVSANTRPHQLRWGDREMGTAISCTECSQVAGLIQKSVETPRKHRACEKDGEEGERGQIHSVERVHVGKMRGEGEGEDKCVWWRECMQE